MPSEETIYLQGLLDRFRQGDLAARNHLLEGASNRLLRLARKMLHDFPQVSRRLETEDLLQTAVVRLCEALRMEPAPGPEDASAPAPPARPGRKPLDRDQLPPTVLDFFRLAAVQIRRELLDLARSLSRRPEVQAPSGEDSSGQGLPAMIDTTSEPQKLTIWAEYHRRVEALPDDERAVVDLVWYQGVKKKEAAELLGVSLATLTRRWVSARVKLQQVLQGDPPAS